MPDLLVSPLRLRATAGTQCRGRAGPDARVLCAVAGEGFSGWGCAGEGEVPHVSTGGAEAVPEQRVGAGTGAKARRRLFACPAGDRRGRDALSGGTRLTS